METLIILGACGSACEVYSRLMAAHPSVRVVFVDDKSDTREIRLGAATVPVVKDWDFTKYRAGRAGDFRQFVCGSGNPATKRILVARALAAGLEPAPTLLDPLSTIHSDDIGRGGFIGPFCTVSPFVKIADYVHLFTLVCIGHNSTVDNFVTCAPGVVLPGTVHLGEGAFMGVGAVTRHNIGIASGTTVGAQSCVLRSVVEENTVMSGVPAVKHD